MKEARFGYRSEEIAYSNRRKLMAWKYAVFTVMCPSLNLEETAELAGSLGLDGLEWRVTKKAAEPITQVSYWGANRSTVDIDDVDADLPRAQKIAAEHKLAMPVLMR